VGGVQGACRWSVRPVGGVVGDGDSACSHGDAGGDVHLDDDAICGDVSRCASDHVDDGTAASHVASAATNDHGHQGGTAATGYVCTEDDHGYETSYHVSAPDRCCVDHGAELLA